MKIVNFKEAYDAYNNGHFIQSPEGKNYQRVQNRLGQISPESFFKDWKILESHEGIKKVKKWRYIYKNYNSDEIYQISPPFENEEAFRWFLCDLGDHCEPCKSVSRIEESESEYDVII